MGVVNIDKTKVWLYRVIFCILGFSLFAGPLALIPRLTNQDIPDIHSLCLKMPVNAFSKGLVMFDFTDPIWIILYFWLGTILIISGLIIGPLFFGRHFS